MQTLNPKIDLYLADGCGRCAYYATAKCKVKKWQDELHTLRQIVLTTGLQEELKWSIPVYTHNAKNIITVAALKDYVFVSFFKGVLLKDTQKLLSQQGNIQSGRLLKFTTVKEIVKLQKVVKEYIAEAIAIEENNVKVTMLKNPEPVPQELLDKFVAYPALKKSFHALTQGRQQGYIIYFSQPKQSSTRQQRIEKCLEKIMKGEGINDDYKSKKA